MASWCADHGLPGIAPHEAEKVSLTPHPDGSATRLVYTWTTDG